jgi:hypothetical protein
MLLPLNGLVPERPRLGGRSPRLRNTRSSEKGFYVAYALSLAHALGASATELLE